VRAADGITRDSAFAQFAEHVGGALAGQTEPAATAATSARRNTLVFFSSRSASDRRLVGGVLLRRLLRARLQRGVVLVDVNANLMFDRVYS